MKMTKITDDFTKYTQKANKCILYACFWVETLLTHVNNTFSFQKRNSLLKRKLY